MSTLSFTQASDFANCEVYWWHKYQLEQRPDPTPAMLLGSLVTAGVDGLYTESTDADIAALMLEAVGGTAPLTTLEKAVWLIERYQTHYAAEIASVQQYIPEQAIEYEYEGWTIRCRIDGLKTDAEGRLWVVERKTTGRPTDVLGLAPHSPQVTMYDIAARAAGLEPYGVEYDVVNSYQWKNPRPPAASFDRLHFDKDDTQRNQALAWLDSIICRIEDVQAGAIPIRNVGRGCNYCPFKGPCLEGLAFGEGITLTDG